MKTLITVMLSHPHDRPLPGQIYQVFEQFLGEIMEFRQFSFNSSMMKNSMMHSHFSQSRYLNHSFWPKFGSFALSISRIMNMNMEICLDRWINSGFGIFLSPLASNGFCLLLARLPLVCCLIIERIVRIRLRKQALNRKEDWSHLESRWPVLF